MSREIKFRFWDSKKEEYVNLANTEFEFTPDNKEPQILAFGFNERFIVEQYTGLKDKNGKEICEGDIVNLEYYEKPFSKKRWNKTYQRKGGKDINIVGFEDGYFKFYERDRDGYGSELSFSDYGEWETNDGAYKYVAKIIGNIHEPPKDFRPEHLKRMGVSISKGGKE